jgi:hypothetical protein
MSTPTTPQPMSTAARQIHASSRAIVSLTLGLTGLAMGASFTLSFHAQAAVGQAIGLTDGLQFALPAATDLWILSALLTLSVLRARGQGEGVAKTGRARFGPGQQALQRLSLIGWTVASVGINVGHALAVYRGTDAVGLAAVSGVAILFPLGVLAGSEAVLALTLSPVDAPAVARAKTTLVNARIPVASATTARRSPQDPDLDAVIAAALTAPAASLRGVAGDLGTTVYRVRSVKSRLVPTGA